MTTARQHQKAQIDLFPSAEPHRKGTKRRKVKKARPSREKKGRDIQLRSVRREYLDDYSRAVELARLGARPPVIRSLCPRVTETQSLMIYKEIVGRNPPQGQLPRSYDLLTGKLTMRWQGSVIVAAYTDVRGNMEVVQDACLEAYRHYQRVFDGQRLLFSFDRAWMLLRAIQIRELLLLRCTVCDSRYIHNRHDLVDHDHKCPVCVDLRRSGLTRVPNAQPSANSALIRKRA